MGEHCQDWVEHFWLKEIILCVLCPNHFPPSENSSPQGNNGVKAGSKMILEREHLELPWDPSILRITLSFTFIKMVSGTNFLQKSMDLHFEVRGVLSVFPLLFDYLCMMWGECSTRGVLYWLSPWCHGVRLQVSWHTDCTRLEVPPWS